MRWRPHLHVSYCTNVHPGERLEDLIKIVREDVGGVRSSISPNAPFGSGLRLGAESVYALRSSPHALNRLKMALEETDVYVFSVNGFPYGDFAAEEVKAEVYTPDWSTEERTRYTLALAEVLTQLPGPSVRSISTVAGGFQPHPLTDSRGALFSIQFASVAQGLADLEARTGIRVNLALEPEPWTSIETTPQAIAFFERWVWPSSPLAQRYIGLCYDTCHQAVAFEDPKESWASLRRAGVPIFKVQISNALHLADPMDDESRRVLMGFNEPRYLHQVTALTPEGTVLRAVDLTDPQLDTSLWREALAWRCHFHVPLWWTGADGLETTQSQWRQVADLISRESASATEIEPPLHHVEVETYSWGVIPASHRQGLGDLRACVVRELDALKTHI